MRTDRRLTGAAGAALLTVSMASGAHAAALEANGYDWSLLFDPASHTARGTVVYVGIDHDQANSSVFPDGRTVVETEDRIFYNFGIKADLAPNLRCLVSAQNPFGSEIKRDPTYAALVGKAQHETLTSIDAGLTCAYGIAVGPGTVSVIGGVSAQSITYEADLPISLVETMPLEIDGLGLGLRAGLAYEIPEYAVRVSAIYNAPIEYQLEGTAFGLPATAEATTPQSISINAQTGIAPGWLALASIKWTDWSVLQSLDVNTATGTISQALSYRDSWLLSAGLGHQVNDQFSLVGIVSYDQGASNKVGNDLYETGTSSDQFGVALGGFYDLTETMQISGALSLSRLADGANLDGESWDDSHVVAVSGGLKGSF